MEEDPMITQRMRDISRTLCTKYGDLLNECGKRHGLMVWYHCQAERDEVVKCMEGWQQDPDFKEKVTEVGGQFAAWFSGGFKNLQLCSSLNRST